MKFPLALLNVALSSTLVHALTVTPRDGDCTPSDYYCAKDILQ